MFAVGDILLINAPIADHKKYHICLGQNEYTVTICLFLNSEGKYVTDLEMDCARLPMLPASKTGKSVVSLSMLPRYTEKQLVSFGARKIDDLPKDVAVDIIAACAAVKTLPKPEREFVVARLTQYVNA